MTHIKGWTVLSKDHRSVLRSGWLNINAVIDRWVPIGKAVFRPCTEHSAQLYELESEAKQHATEVGGVIHRVDREE